MKKILSLFLLICLSYSAEPSAQPALSKKSGWFLGAGVGMGINALKFQSPKDGEWKQTSLSNVFSGKLGGYYRFSNRVALRYYYALDLNVTLGETKNKLFDTQPNGFLIFSQSYTINADSVVNLYSNSRLKLELITGMGAGTYIGEYNIAYKNSIFGGASSQQPFGASFESFEFRLNLGLRLMFDEKYGIELMAKLPVTPVNKNAIIQADNPGSPDKGRYFSSHPNYLTFDLVMEF